MEIREELRKSILKKIRNDEDPLEGFYAPENVKEAINVVQPWGVDSLTHTNRPLPDGGFQKDIDRIRLFAEAAHGASN